MEKKSRSGKCKNECMENRNYYKFLDEINSISYNLLGFSLRHIWKIADVTFKFNTQFLLLPLKSVVRVTFLLALIEKEWKSEKSFMLSVNVAQMFPTFVSSELKCLQISQGELVGFLGAKICMMPFSSGFPLMAA